MTRIENTWFWIGLALLLKIIVIFFLIYNLSLLNRDGLIGICSGDCADYLHTAQNIVKHFTFGKVYEGVLSPYKGRMPGYDIVLAPLSLFLQEKNVINFTILLQIALSAISTYFLAKIAYLIFKTQYIFYTVFFIYAINIFVSIYDLHILTESFSISALIISIYLILYKPSKINYFISGFLFTWAFLMRPFFGVILLFVISYLIYKHLVYLKQTFRQSIIYLFIYLLPFCLTEAIWTYRNYLQFNRFIPLAEGGFNEGRRLSLMNLMSAWGFDFTDWNPNSEMLVFLKPIVNLNIKPRYTKVEDLPTYIYTSTYNIDSLKNIQILLDRINSSKIAYTEYTYLDSIINHKLKQYKEDFIHEKPFHYYFTAPLRLMGKFLLHSGTYNISNKPFLEQPIYSQILKIIYSILYYFVLLAGFFSYIFLIEAKRIEVYLLLSIPFYIIILFTFFIRAIEYRYLTTAYPFLSILACYMLNLLMSYFNKFQKI